MPHATPFADMPSDLDFGEPTPARPVSESGVQRFVTAQRPTKEYREPCGKCHGTGVWRGGWSSGTCFACKGAKFFTFKSSPEARAKARSRAADRKEQVQMEQDKQRAAQAAEWRDHHPAEAAWIDANAARFDFAASMRGALTTWGALSPNQLGAVQRCMAKDVERAAAKSAEQAKSQAANVDRLPALHAVLQRHAKFYAGDLTISRRNADQLCWIKFEGVEKVIGKIDQGHLTLWNRPGVDLNKVRDLLAEFEGAPLQTAMKYGKLAGRCCSCGRELTNDGSIEAGIGPICAEKFQ